MAEKRRRSDNPNQNLNTQENSDTQPSISKKEFAITLPSELVILISQLFESASDVLSFALVNKRFFNIILANIKDKNNKQAEFLLSLHTKKILGCILDPLSHHTIVFLFSCLPNQTIHGAVERRMILEAEGSGFLDKARALWQLACEEGKSSRSFGFDYEGRSASYIFTPARYRAAMEILADAEIKDHSFLWTQEYRYFGLIEGDYKSWMFRGGQAHLTQEVPYANGRRDGELRRLRMYKGSLMAKNADHSGKISSITSWKNDKKQEVREYWEGTSTLRRQTQYQSAELHGLEEVWAETGIRTSRASWQDNQKHGKEEAWDRNTGQRLSVVTWLHGKKTKEKRFTVICYAS